MIEFDHVSRNYGGNTAVSDLSLEVSAGEIFAFLGPNGAGKTTSIKMLVGLLRPSQGTVRVCGYDIARQPREACRRVGYVPDEPYLYDKLTGRELFQFIAEVYGLDRQDAGRRIDREIERFQLAEFVDQPTESYSHGMKQRTVFATALLHQPPVLVVDEPMVGLDPHSIRLVKELLREYALGGAAVFMSTHTLSVAEEIADRIGILQRGRLAYCGTVDQLRSDRAREQHGLERLYLELLDGQSLDGQLLDGQSLDGQNGRPDTNGRPAADAGPLSKSAPAEPPSEE